MTRIWPLLAPALAAGLVLVAGAPAQAQATWALVASPNGPGSNELLAVAGSTGNQVWAVGRVLDFNVRPTTYRSLLLRWNGSTWAPATHPTFAGNSLLDDVDAPASGAAWAVGSRYEASGAGRTLVERFDGVRWSVVASPSPNPNGNNHLAGVAAIPSTSDGVWAVGSYSTPGSSIGSTTLILQRTGGTWRQFATPAVTVTNVLEAVDAIGPRDAWAVGWGSTSPFGGTAVGIALRWDGTRWAAAPIPQPSPVMLFGVEVVAANNVWAVGQTYLGGAHWVPLILRWNGSAWSRATLPAFPAGGLLRNVVALSPRDVYAVGTDGEGSSGRTLVLHWDGAAWTRELTPSPQVGPKLFGAAAIAPGTVWAVGHRYDQAAGDNRTLTIRTTNG